MNSDNKITLASIILPIKYSAQISYAIPPVYQVERGSHVMVDFAGKLYSGIVEKTYTIEKEQISSESEINGEKKIIYKPILKVEELPKVSELELKLWENISNYYLCSIGEVYKAAYPASIKKQENVKSKKTPEKYIASLPKISEIIVPQLSQAQLAAEEQIEKYLKDKKPVLLDGVTGSGKTEIYINLAQKELEKGKSVLYMVPEIALSKQLYQRLKSIFGDRLLTFHSKQTAANKALIYKILTHSTHTPTIVLGTRSSLFLPLKELGLIIVDEEHDPSYKQTEPAPRYNGRDAAIMLSILHESKIIFGSASPSFETLYNCATGKYNKVELTEKYYGGKESEIEIIDTINALKTRQIKGNFTQKLINEIARTIQNGNQVLIFKNRRSYAPIVECTECGTIPKCPHCNVYLSYHKQNNTLRCHYCDYITHFSKICTKCGLDTLKYKGVGTEKLEEELKSLFPERQIARYDSDITKSKKEEEKIIKEFSSGEIDILVGTQMITKGFDFENLKLVAVIQGETILGIQDFRADERGIQLLKQLMGRCGRRGERGKILIQSNIADHPVYDHLKDISRNNIEEKRAFNQILMERKEFDFPPFVRLVKIIVKHQKLEKVTEICNKILELDINCKELSGPFTPQIDKIRGEHIKCFYAKFNKDANLTKNKKELVKKTNSLKTKSIIMDVDPI